MNKKNLLKLQEYEKLHTNNTKNQKTNTRVAKTIINNSDLINANQTAEKIGMLKKDMKQVDAENLLNALPLVQENGELAPILPPKEYVYFTIPVNKVKHDPLQDAVQSQYQRRFPQQEKPGRRSPLSLKRR